VRSSREGYAALMPLYLQGRQQTYPQGMIDLVPDKFAVRALLDDTVSACRTEILISKHGGAFSPSSLEEALPRDLELLGRGVSMRSLYQHATRFDPATRAHALRLIDAGARIRTQTEVLPKIIIVDAETAFLRARDGGALVIREPALLSYLITTFERDWESATPYATGPRMAHEISQTLKQHILVLLAKGLKDEAIARRVGISLRTCRRHVSELLESLGAHSRFQAGVIAERHGLTTPSSLPADADLPQSQPAAPEPVPAPAPAAAGPDRSCPGCGRPLPVAGPVGRPARYCSSRCRSRAYRARRRDGAAERDEIARPRDEMPVARPPFER
jgi:DNA-binding CsgD family transcriptional regulator